MEDEKIMASEKVELWVPLMAELFGRALALLFKALLDHESTIPLDIYASTVQEFQ